MADGDRSGFTISGFFTTVNNVSQVTVLTLTPTLIPLNYHGFIEMDFLYLGSVGFPGVKKYVIPFDNFDGTVTSAYSGFSAFQAYNTTDVLFTDLDTTTNVNNLEVRVIGTAASARSYAYWAKIKMFELA